MVHPCGRVQIQKAGSHNDTREPYATPTSFELCALAQRLWQCLASFGALRARLSAADPENAISSADIALLLESYKECRRRVVARDAQAYAYTMAGATQRGLPVWDVHELPPDGFEIKRPPFLT